MFLLRRTAFKALTTPSASLLSKPRSFSLAARAPVLSKQQWAVPSLQRRFASDDAAAIKEENLEEPISTEKVSEDIVVEPATASEAETVADETAADVDTQTEKVDSVTENAFGAAKDAVNSTVSSAQDAVSSMAGAVSGALGGSGSRSSSQARPRNDAMGLGPKIEPSATLYVGNLFFEVSEEALERQFAHYGTIKKVRIIYDHRGLSKGFGYVEFEDVNAATAAINALNQEVFQGRRMAVQFHRRREPISLSTPRQPHEPSKTLFIGNMSFEMSDKDLNDLFREVRNVIDVRVAIDRRTGQPRGFAHADFVDVDSAIKAREFLKDKEIYGRKLRVDYSASSTTTQRGGQ
ncbi:RNA-binding domain-containing protein [Tothia fuscella]|uniref:RNA-binding domain-containing protein n=1 Tax=Tothia fuscella TaxID=1048955 RepID=A0A9P4P1G3_9PEZI|nr:RNA-binding domain-containing protein [Tothia fuscella]